MQHTTAEGFNVYSIVAADLCSFSFLYELVIANCTCMVWRKVRHIRYNFKPRLEFFAYEIIFSIPCMVLGGSPNRYHTTVAQQVENKSYVSPKPDDRQHHR